MSSGVISPRTVQRFREGFSASAEAIADELVVRREFDIVTDLTEGYPLKVFPDIVGLPSAGRENLLPYGELAFNALGPRNARLEEALAKAATVQEWIGGSCPREALDPEGLGAAIWAAADSDDITEEQAPMLVRSLLSAGVDTTVYGIANTMQGLSANSDQWAALHDKPVAKFAFDEALRYAGWCSSPWLPAPRVWPPRSTAQTVVECVATGPEACCRTGTVSSQEPAPTAFCWASKRLARDSSGPPPTYPAAPRVESAPELCPGPTRSPCTDRRAAQSGVSGDAVGAGEDAMPTCR
jgi:hypothetical protein